MAQRLHARVHRAPVITGVSVCESVQESDSAGFLRLAAEPVLLSLSPLFPL